MTKSFELRATIPEMNYLFNTLPIRMFEVADKKDWLNREDQEIFNVEIRMSDELESAWNNAHIEDVEDMLMFAEENCIFEPFEFDKKVGDKYYVPEYNYCFMGGNERISKFLTKLSLEDKPLIIVECIESTMEQMGGYYCAYQNTPNKPITDPILADTPYLFDLQ